MAKKNIKFVVPNITELDNGWLKSSYKSSYKFEQKPLMKILAKLLMINFSNEYFGYE